MKSKLHFELQKLLFLLLCFCNLQQLLAAPPSSFSLGDRYPNKDEVEVCGSIRDIITRNSGRYRKILVRNSNSDIEYLNEDSRRTTTRGNEKLNALASKVKKKWPGVKLRVILAWTDQKIYGQASLYYEGRALRLQTTDGDRGKLGELAHLAVQSGFDWVKYETDSYIHVSVLRDVCQSAVDLAFILDSSGSIGKDNFEKVKDFVENIINFFSIGVNGTHVAVVKFWTENKIEFNFNNFTNKVDMIAAVKAIKYRAGFTYTAEAIERTRTEVFSKARPDKGIPKVAVLVTDGNSMGNPLNTPVAEIKKIGVNMFAVGVGDFISRSELNLIATDPDETHVFEIDTFNDFSSWVDKISSVSCDEGAFLSSCDDTTTTVESGSFKYFRTQFTVVNDRISVELNDIKGISHLYVSSTSTNPGPLDSQSIKNESNYSPKSVSITPNANKLVYVAVQGQMDNNQFTISLWDALFSKEYFQWLIKENTAPPNNFSDALSPHQDKYNLEYSIKAGNDPPYFTINKDTGTISLSRSLDREKQASFKLAIQASNKDNKCHKGRTWVTVVVEDENDNYPQFSKTQYTAKVKENKVANTFVTVVTATDADLGENAKLTYSIRNGNSNGDFRIDDQGRVYTTRPLNFETQSSYTLTIRASDNGNPSKDNTTTLIVNVEDVNEQPMFLARCVTFNNCSMKVSENSAAGTILGNLSAVDPDSGNCALVYTITSSDAQGVFAINSQGYIRTLRVLDREIKESYQVLVKVHDCGSPSLEISSQITVTVLDENDNDPVFSPSTYNVGFYEDVQGGTVVTQVTASDADKGINANLRYNLTAGDTSFFVIDQSGIIRTAHGKSFDRETKASYTITVTAEDSGTQPRRSTAQVAVTVFDINDNNPQFSSNPPHVEVREDESLSKSIANVSATDIDTGINADLRYSLISGNEGGMFSLNSQTGVLTLLKQLDYENKNKYTLRLRATDRGLPARFSERILDINVLDVNDNAPLFSPASYQATIEENSARDTQVTRVIATDQDSGNDGKIKYFITSGNTAGTFKLHPDNGILSVENPPDFENPNLRRFDLQVEARDQGVPSKTAFANVRVIIEDVNDNSPTFQNTPYTVSINESSSVGSLVITATATDIDFGPRGRVSYRITSGNSEQKFAMDTNTGKITIAASLDREKRDRYTLTIEAADAGTPQLRAQEQVVVTVTDANDNSPQFRSSSYTFRVTEQSKPTAPVGQVSATDKDLGENGRVTYSMAVNIDGMFKLDSNNGQMSLLKEPDRERTPSYLLTLIAKDQGNPSRTTAVSVTVIVDDLNDNAPKFSKSNYTCQVGENLASNIPVCGVQANDPDSGLNGQVSYSITGGNTGNAFSINSNTGEITTNQILDREEVATYRLEITAKDGAPALGSTVPHSAITTVIISVLDENDNQPVFDRNPYLIRVSENKPIGYPIGSVNATDQDDGTNGLVVYSIFSGNTGNSFKINSANGSITVSKSLDRENIERYQLSVQAKDSGNPALSATTTVVVTIQDINDNSPRFTSSAYRGEIREDASVGSTVLQVKAADRDSGSNAKLTYSLSGQRKTDFRVDLNGFIVSNNKLDYETKSVYYLVVTATDAGVPSKSASANVTVNIINVNDNAPEFNFSRVIRIREDVAVNTEVVRFKATDADGDKLHLNFTSGNERGDFKIQNDSGLVQVAQRLDRETIDHYRIVVMVTDPSNQFTTQNLSIMIEDANDNAPEFLNQSYAASVPENSISGFSVVKVSATDDDIGKNAEITYSISSGDTAKFTIDSKSGLISTTKGLDREQMPFYTLRVTAKDNGNPSLSSVVSVQITVLDENDNSPIFSQSVYNVNVMENTANNTVVLRAQATDPDEGDNGRIQYRIIGGANGMFAIDPDTGAVRVVQILDREATSSYTLKIQASDSGSTPNKATVDVIVTVGDENDNAPIIASQASPFVVTENSATGTTVGVVQATDADEGSNGHFTFSITDGNPDEDFEINATSGVISVKGSIDREKLSSYNITIMATDKGSPQSKSSKKVFVISVNDVNDNAPVFDKGKYKGFVEENKNKDTFVVNVTATDRDTGVNAQISYNITGGNNKGHFKINPQNGYIFTTARLDFESVPSYTLTVQASDGPHKTFVQVEITVVNLNDNSPKFSKDLYLFNVNENSKLSTSIGNVTASDLDDFGGLVYAIEGGHSKFSIDPTTGVISTADYLDRETMDHYFFTVIATDRGTPSQSVKANVTVTVTDVNDNPPVIAPRTFTVSIREDTAVGTRLTKLNATDEDIGINAQVIYNISYESVPNTFRIDENTGVITTGVKLDAEQIRNYRLICEATDQGNPRLTSNPVTITVVVEDVNDNTPQFQPPYKLEVNENVALGTVVGEVSATDADSGSNGEVVYSIIAASDRNMFVIESTTGIITTNGSLDRESRDSYTLRVRAEDKGAKPKGSNATVTITVKDVNDHQPQFQSPLSGSVKENEPKNTFVMRLAATDQDIGSNALLTFTFENDQYKDTFSLNSSSGEIHTKKQLDREMQEKYTMKVRVSDAGNPPLSSITDITITIIDEDDNCPTLNPKEYRVTISENSTVGTSVIRVYGKDKDVGAELIYAIQSGNTGGAFRIEHGTGIIRVSNAGVDREVNGENFKLIIRAGRESCGLNQTGCTGPEGEGCQDVKLPSLGTVFVTVTDVNDNPPEFSKSLYEWNYKNFSSHKLGSVEARDRDLGDGGKVKFRLENQIQRGGSWDLTIVAYDLGKPSLESKATVKVTPREPCEAMVFFVSDRGEVTVKTLCSFNSHSEGKELLLGDRYKLTCEAKGFTEQPKYNWQRNGKIVSDWLSHGNYEITAATQKDKGLYSCLASNGAGTIQSTLIQVQVYEKPRITKQPENTTAESGKTGKLECEATGDPEVSYQWLKNGRRLFSDENVVEPQNATLTIRNIERKYHEVGYVCRATNTKGQAESRKAFIFVYNPNALVMVKLEVNKQDREKKCFTFNAENFKEILSKELQSKVFISNMKYNKSQLCSVDPCDPSPCKNGAHCQKQSNGGYSCLCVPGWDGDHCEVDINECLQKPCGPNGTCQNAIGTYSCQCPRGFIGRKCDLRVSSCKPNTCRSGQVCALTANKPKYDCINETNVIVMLSKEKVDADKKFHLEMDIESLIRTKLTTNRQNSVQGNSRSRRSVEDKSTVDYGVCTVRIVRIRDKEVHFVLLCSKNDNLDAAQVKKFVCDLLFANNRTTSCGDLEEMSTPSPPPPVKPLEIEILFFARDKNDEEVNSEMIVNSLNDEKLREKLQKKMGVEVKETRTHGNKQKRKTDDLPVGAILGIVATLVVVALLVILIVVLYYRRKADISSSILLHDRARMNTNRRDSRENVLFNDIKRSEKKYINKAFESGDEDDDCDNFMIQVNLKEDANKTSALDELRQVSYYHGLIPQNTAETRLGSSMTPGTFLVREGTNVGEFFLSVKCPPERGPKFRHLLIKHSKDGKEGFTAQFGTMKGPRKFETMTKLITNFQIEPISFDDSSPDVILTNPWNKSAV